MKKRVLWAEAILFDLDGVLANSIAVVEKSWRLWAEAHSLDAEPILNVAHGRRTAEILQMIAPDLDLAAEIERFVEMEQSLLDQVTEIPGALEFVMSLPRERWAIGTSGERAVALGRLRKFGFPIPSVLVAAEDVRVGKPGPEVYRKAAAGLGVPPENCVVFEDAPAGVSSALAAGARAVGVLTTYPASELAEAAECIRDFSGVTAEMGAAGGPMRITMPPR